VNVTDSSSTPSSSQKSSKLIVPSDRSIWALGWYRVVQSFVRVLCFALGGFRATGRENIPAAGAGILVSNHLSHLDVFLLGLPLRRPLNYVARSTLFLPGLGFLIRSVGGFPIQREGMGAAGLKETLKRLRAGGIVALFPEGTRSQDGELGELKSGIAVLAKRARAPIIPAGIAGTFEAWPRHRRFPRPHALRIHFGPPIAPEAIDGLEPDAVVQLMRESIVSCIREARDGLARDRAR
jgi:1-acyl-sn-glycerol-3-phosphate acyltransferase